jgi:hypothetical protein
MANTLAVHWAATTHGTWLHGDARGSWRNGRLISRDPYLEAECRALLASGAVRLDDVEPKLIAVQFGDVVRQRGHRVFAATIQRAHAHIVFGPLREDVKNVIARLKRRASMAVLARRRDLYSPAILAGSASGQDGRAISVPTSLWTAGQFPVYIFSEQHLANAIEYVRDHNRRAGLAPDPFDWIEPLFPAGQRVNERSNLRTGEQLRL